MREILFRGKQVDDGKWLYGDLIQSVDKSEVAIIEEKDCFVCNAETVGQFTGLTDKNDKKIFEGDIVNFFGMRGVIHFECACFGIGFNDILDWEQIEAEIKHYTGCDNRLYACENDNFVSLWEIYWNFDEEEDGLDCVEVIGNIYDNPELLRKIEQFGNSEQLKK